MRAVVEVAGIRDLLSKNMGSTNPVNVVRATIEALASLRSADEIAGRRGKTAEQLLGKRAAEAARQPHVYVERPQQMRRRPAPWPLRAPRATQPSSA